MVAADSVSTHGPQRRELDVTAAAAAAAIGRSHQALRDSSAFVGALRPRFAFGTLDKPSHSRAHLMHLAHAGPNGSAADS